MSVLPRTARPDVNNHFVLVPFFTHRTSLLGRRLFRGRAKSRMSYLKYFCIIATGLGLMNNTVEAVENRISLRVSGLPNPSQTDPVSTAAQRVAERFLELNPDIELVPAEGIRIDTVPSEVTTIMMISGDIAPDVLTMNFRSVDTFVSQGMVEPLDAYVAKEEARGGNVQDRILPQIRDVVYRPNAKGERHLYGLPEEMLVTGIYFNRELFLRADLPERAPKDWKELEEFAAKITALGPGYKGIHLRGGAQASWNLMNFLWSAGGDAVEEIAPNEWRATFNTDAAVEAYEFYYKLVEIEDNPAHRPGSRACGNDLWICGRNHNRRSRTFRLWCRAQGANGPPRSGGQLRAAWHLLPDQGSRSEGSRMALCALHDRTGGRAHSGEDAG